MSSYIKRYLHVCWDGFPSHLIDFQIPRLVFFLILLENMRLKQMYMAGGWRNQLFTFEVLIVLFENCTTRLASFIKTSNYLSFNKILQITLCTFLRQSICSYFVFQNQLLKCFIMIHDFSLQMFIKTRGPW
jgi:hypothetical protein